jgi:hypothetical protein
MPLFAQFAMMIFPQFAAKRRNSPQNTRIRCNLPHDAAKCRKTATRCKTLQTPQNAAKRRKIHKTPQNATKSCNSLQNVVPPLNKLVK